MAIKGGSPRKGSGPSGGDVWDVFGKLAVGGIIIGLAGYGWAVLCGILTVPAAVLAIRILEWLLGGGSEPA